jgi:uncharacterized protein
MKLEQSFALQVPREKVWELFTDVDTLVGCLPGASLQADIAEGQPLQLGFQVKLGPIVASFSGTGRVTYEPETFSGHFTGQGADRRSNTRVKGDAHFEIEEQQQDGAIFCRVMIAVDYALSGALAQFSRASLIKEIASSITAQFAENLRHKLQKEVEAHTSVQSAAYSNSLREPDQFGESHQLSEAAQRIEADQPPQSIAVTPADATPKSVSKLHAAPASSSSGSLNLGAIIKRLVWERIRRLFTPR